jgi:DNA recombination protein RmuC
MELLYLFAGLILGALLAAVLVYNRFMSGGQYVASKTVSENFVLKEIFQDLEKRFFVLETDVKDKSLKIIDLNKDLSSQEQINAHLDEKLNVQKQELGDLQKRFQTEFENIANRLLEENSQKFTTQNAKNLNEVLLPLNF